MVKRRDVQNQYPELLRKMTDCSIPFLFFERIDNEFFVLRKKMQAEASKGIVFLRETARRTKLISTY